VAGHSKFANIKHRKEGQDKKRGRVFTKIIREIFVAVKACGPQSNANPRLRAALVNAKSVNLPKDKIDKTIKKASGLGDEDYQEVTFEGYGPEGVAIFIECATNNNTRTVANIRSYFNKFQGGLGKDGCLEFVFERKGIFIINKGTKSGEDELMLELIDAGVEDVKDEDARLVLVCNFEKYGSVSKKIQDLGIEPIEVGLHRIPLVEKTVENGDVREIIEKLIDVIEEDDDVQRVYHNMK
jgi:YebC/PmpR family DNA-binding regulatory protein